FKTDLVFVFGADITLQRRAEQGLRQAEKLATLGTLAAGIAHELNNPAAAMRRSATQLRNPLEDLERARESQGSFAFTPKQHATLSELATIISHNAEHPVALSMMQRSDLETKCDLWMGKHRVENADDLSPALVNAGLSPEHLAK